MITYVTCIVCSTTVKFNKKSKGEHEDVLCLDCLGSSLKIYEWTPPNIPASDEKFENSKNVQDQLERLITCKHNIKNMIVTPEIISEFKTHFPTHFSEFWLPLTSLNSQNFSSVMEEILNRYEQIKNDSIDEEDNLTGIKNRLIMLRNEFFQLIDKLDSCSDLLSILNKFWMFHKIINSYGGFAKTQLKTYIFEKKNFQVKNIVNSLDESIRILAIDEKSIFKKDTPILRCPRCNHGPVQFDDCPDLMVKYGPGVYGDKSGLGPGAVIGYDLRCPHCLFYSYGKPDWIQFGKGNWKLLPVVKGGLWEPLDCTDQTNCYDITNENWKKKIGQPPARMPCDPWSKNPGRTHPFTGVWENGWELPCDYQFNIRNKINSANDLKEFLFKRKQNKDEISFYVTNKYESINKTQQESIRRIMGEVSHLGVSTEKAIEALQQTGWQPLIPTGSVSDMQVYENLIKVLNKLAELYVQNPDIQTQLIEASSNIKATFGL